MKKSIILIAALFLFLPFVSAVVVDYDSASINKTGNLGEFPILAISQLKYEPYPVEPGERFDLWIKFNPALFQLLEATYGLTRDVNYGSYL